MALTVVQLQARLDAVSSARDAGVLRVRHGDEETFYRSLSEMNSIIAGLQSRIDSLNGVKRRKVRYIEQNDKGLGPDGLTGFRHRRF